MSSIEFTLRPGEVRTVRDGAVEALDAALAAAGSGAVNHFFDPRRLQIFAAGGPPVWSVATVPIGEDTLYVTYGLCEAIDEAQEGLGFELSVRVPGPPAVWAALFLRGLCRYILTSGRTLEVGQFMAFPGPLTRFAVAPAEAGAMPDTGLRAACFAADPDLGTVATPHGPIEVRRVVGVFLDELALFETWSAAGFLEVVRARDPGLRTDPDRASLAGEPSVVAAIAAGSAREGSAFGYVAVAGVSWEAQDGSVTARFPGGADAERVARMIAARLPFGRHLLIHDVDPEQPLAVALEPSETLEVQVDGSILVVRVPPEHPLLGTFAQASAEGVRWSFR